MYKWLLILITGAVLLSNCKPKDEVLTTSGSSLRFSSDTILFDTIFTSIGSITERFKIYNDNENAISISSINLAGGGGSEFTIIVNGQPGDNFSNLVILGGDSVQVLVSVLINPTAQNLPFLIRDSVEFITNGTDQHVKLMAYGQDAFFVTDSTMPCGSNWAASKPYVIMDSITVPNGCTFTIDKGVQIFMNNDAKINVEGTLIVNGSTDSNVTFCNDNEISAIPGKNFGYWDGIHFKGTSTANVLTGLYMKNGTNGIKFSNGAIVDSTFDLTIRQSIIKDMSENGILSYGTDVLIENSVVTNCTNHAISGKGGGNYVLLHSSVANYGFDFFRMGETIEMNNSDTEGSTMVSNPLDVAFINSVINGSFTEELDIAGYSSLNGTHSNIRTQTGVFGGNNNQVNYNPSFLSPENQDLTPDSLSVLIDSAVNVYSLPMDINGKARTNADIGAIEY